MINLNGVSCSNTTLFCENVKVNGNNPAKITKPKINFNNDSFLFIKRYFLSETMVKIISKCVSGRKIWGGFRYENGGGK